MFPRCEAVFGWCLFIHYDAEHTLCFLILTLPSYCLLNYLFLLHSSRDENKYLPGSKNSSEGEEAQVCYEIELLCLY